MWSLPRVEHVTPDKKKKKREKEEEDKKEEQKYKLVELVGVGSVINGAYSV